MSVDFFNHMNVALRERNNNAVSVQSVVNSLEAASLHPVLLSHIGPKRDKKIDTAFSKFGDDHLHPLIGIDGESSVVEFVVAGINSVGNNLARLVNIGSVSDTDVQRQELVFVVSGEVFAKS